MMHLIFKGTRFSTDQKTFSLVIEPLLPSNLNSLPFKSCQSLYHNYNQLKIKLFSSMRKKELFENERMVYRSVRKVRVQLRVAP